MKPKQQKIDEAKIRQAEYDALSPGQKLDRTMQAPGKSARQVKRLLKESANG